MDGKKRARLRRQAHGVDVTVEIGKGGITPAVVGELEHQLETHPLVKVRLRPSARTDDDAQRLAEELAARTGSALVEVRGHTAVFTRERSPRA